MNKTTRIVVMALGALLIPEAALVKFHMDLKNTPDGKLRMLTHMVSALGSLKLFVFLLHKWMFTRQPFWAVKMPGLALLGGVSVAGFWGGRKLGEALFPKQKKPSTLSASPIAPAGSLPTSIARRRLTPRVYPAMASTRLTYGGTMFRF